MKVRDYVDGQVVDPRVLAYCDTCDHPHFNTWGGYYEDCPWCAYGCERVPGSG